MSAPAAFNPQYMQQSLNQNNKRSPGYNILAQAMIYNFKEGSNIKNRAWTPHNIKAIKITMQGIVVYKYMGEPLVIKYTAYKNLCGALTPMHPEFYLNMLDCLHTLDRGTSAKVKNIQDIIIMTGCQDGIGIPPSAAKHLFDNFNTAPNTGITPNIILLDSAVYATSQDIISEGKQMLIRSHIKDCGLSQVYLTQDSNLNWTVSAKKPNALKEEATSESGIQRQSTYTTFGLDNQHTYFENIISIASALEAYSSKQSLNVKIKKNTGDITLSKLFRNQKDYDADVKLGEFFVSRLYKPAAVWEFLSTYSNPAAKKEAIVNADTTKLILDACSLYDKAADYCIYDTNRAYTKNLFLSRATATLRVEGTIVDNIIGFCLNRHTHNDLEASTVHKLVTALLDSPSDSRQGTLATQIGSDYAQKVTDTLLDSIITLATVVEVLYLFRYGFKRSRELTSFLVASSTAKIQGNLPAPPLDVLLPPVKVAVMMLDDAEFTKYYTDDKIHNCVETAYKSLKAVPANKFTAEAIQKHSEALDVLFK